MHNNIIYPSRENGDLFIYNNDDSSKAKVTVACFISTFVIY